MNKDSQLFTIILTIMVFVTVMVVVSKIQAEPLRKPFTPNAFKNDSVVSDDSELDPVETSTASTPTSQPIPSMEMTERRDIQLVEPVRAAKTKSLVGGLKFEILQRAGFQNFVIQLRPFEGKLFQEAPAPELAASDVVVQVVQDAGDKSMILQSFAFPSDSKELNEEMYNLIMGKYKSQIGSDVHETNQFGMKSFYINFEGLSKNVFLVVKTAKAVYALSYVKSYHSQLNELFKFL